MLFWRKDLEVILVRSMQFLESPELEQNGIWTMLFFFFLAVLTVQATLPDSIGSGSKQNHQNDELTL